MESGMEPVNACGLTEQGSLQMKSAERAQTALSSVLSCFIGMQGGPVAILAQILCERVGGGLQVTLDAMPKTGTPLLPENTMRINDHSYMLCLEKTPASCRVIIITIAIIRIGMVARMNSSGIVAKMISVVSTRPDSALPPAGPKHSQASSCFL